MYKLLGSFAVASLASGAIASPADPAITASPSLNKRADSCTFSGEDGAASASASQASCATITLSDVAVPSGTTLDLSDLEDDTTVIPSTLYSLYPALTQIGHLRGYHHLGLQGMGRPAAPNQGQRHHHQGSLRRKAEPRRSPLVGL